MNLIKDPWLPIVRKDGSKEKIAIHELLGDYKENPVMELEAPRPDFRNALYQLLIGIVQVSAMPEDEELWADLFEKPYSPSEFSSKVLKYADCFEIDSEGPAFMQDYDLPEDNKRELKPIYWMTMGSPGKNTIKENKAHFMKDIPNYQLDSYWAAVALFQLQTVGPPDGGGHREGLSGSGALFTIILPLKENRGATLWEKIWLNIFPEDYVSSWNGNISKPIFPWIVPTKISTGDIVSFFDDLHPLSVYWSFPRRIRLKFSKEVGICFLTNCQSNNVVKEYDTIKHGTLYHNTWQHPLVPYTNEIPEKDGKKKNSMRAISSNFIYTNWSSVALRNDLYKNSKIVEYFLSKRQSGLRQTPEIGFSIWVAGFHMKSGEATVINWNESKWPLYDLSPRESNVLYLYISSLASEAIELQKSLIFSLKMAWYKPRVNKKGIESWKKVIDARKFTEYTSDISSSFWQNTEISFYEILEKLVFNLGDVNILNLLVDKWISVLKKEAEALFDSNALAQQEDGLDMKRVIKARQNLGKGIGKMIKNLKTLKEEVEE